MWQLTGRCLAPPITPELLAAWEPLCESDPLRQLLAYVRQAQEVGLAVPRYPMSRLDRWQAEFESLTGEQRRAAFHLLWYAKEIALGRFPG